MKSAIESTVSSFARLKKRIGIDLGTCRVRIWSDQDGFVIDEPTAIAIDRDTQKVLAVGREALEMGGRVKKNIQVSFPVRDGVVYDPKLTAALLKVFLQKIIRSTYFFRPVIMMSIPSGLSEVDRAAMTEMLYGLGAKEVYFITQLLAAAVGAGVPIADASGSFLLQMGGGVVEGGIISLGSLVASETSEYAGGYVDHAIQRVLRREKQIDVGLRVAERLKHKLGSSNIKHVAETLVTGQDIVEAVPKEVIINSQVIFPSIAEVLERYVQLTKKLFEKIPSELTTDIIDKGMLLSGGFAKLDGIDGFMLSALGVPVSIVDEPDQTVIKGLAQVLTNIELFKESLGYIHG